MAASVHGFLGGLLAPVANLKTCKRVDKTHIIRNMDGQHRRTYVGPVIWEAGLAHDLFDDLERLSTYQRAIELQNVLLAACEGKRDTESNRKYTYLRRWARDTPQLMPLRPQFLTANHDLGAFWSYIKNVSDQWEPRRQHVREKLRDFINAAEGVDEPWTETRSSSWTGIKSFREQVGAAKALIPVAQASIEALIDHLERGRGNGGPPLDEHARAIDALRDLHSALGALLASVDDQDARSTKAKAEIVAYLGRAAKELKDDPLPFAVSALIMCVLTTLGYPGVGGWLSAAAINIRKKPEKQDA